MATRLVITSADNARVKLARSLRDSRKNREEQGLFLAEGASLVGDLMDAGLKPQFALVTEAQAAWAQLRPQLLSIFVSEKLMESISSESTPPGVVCVMEQPKHEAVWRNQPGSGMMLGLVLDGLSDPGNVGACVRVAAAAGANMVLVAPGSADVWSPKCLRGAMGAHARVAVINTSWPKVDEIARAAGASLVIADGTAPVRHTQRDWKAPVMLIIGNEAHGPSESARTFATQRVSIGMSNNVESLNAAVACGIVLFEARRQRDVL